MRDFFIPSTNGQLILFTPIHFITLFITLIGVIYLIYKKDWIRSISSKHIYSIKIFMALILFMNMAIYYGSYIYYGVWNYKDNLPLHFCFITGYLWMFSVIFNKKNNLPFLFLFCFIGTIPAMLYWDLKDGLNHYIYYQFTISHNVFLLFSIFIFIADHLKVTKKDIIKAILFANIIFVSMLLFNNLFDTNYIFSKSYPQHIIKLYPFIKYTNPIIMVELLAYLLMTIAYYFSKILSKEHIVLNIEKSPIHHH